MRSPRNRRSRSSTPRPPRPLVAALAGVLALAVWWLGSARPGGDAIRAGVTLPELGLPSLGLREPAWGPLLDPLRAGPFWLASVDFAGLEKLAAPELLAALDLEPIALIDVDPQAVCHKLRSLERRISGCEAARLFPNRLVIQLRERHPIAVIDASGAGIDAEGAAFPLASGEGDALPRLSGNLPGSLAALLEALRAGVAVRAIHAERADDVRVELSDSSTALRLGADARRGLERWQALLHQVSAADLRGIEVDARFRGQVILRDLETVRGPDAVAALGGD